MTKNITILGAGYVGLTTAVVLAHAGYKVFIVEPNPERLTIIKQGRAFFFEPGIDQLLAAALENKSIIPTDSYDASIPNSPIIFSCVGTPDNPDGSSNLSYVFTAAQDACKRALDNTIFVQKSTVPVGTGEKVQEIFRQKKRKISYVSNPEFLREGTALKDALFPDRIVVGGVNKQATSSIMMLYKTIEKNRLAIARRIDIPPNQEKPEYISMNLNSAELTKVSANAFLALKISFANTIARLADQTNADIDEVMQAVGADKRIGHPFLNAGRGYGGGCFPKDVSGLVSHAHDHNVPIQIMQAAQEVNAEMPFYVIDKLKQQFKDNSVKNKSIGILGLAFKAGTSDTRRSPAIHIAQLLSDRGATIHAYDPKVNNIADSPHPSITITPSIDELLETPLDAVVIATEWPEFRLLDFAKFKTVQSQLILVDAVNLFKDKPSSVLYTGIGR